MGSAASRASFRLSLIPGSPDEKLNVQRCKALAREKFDQELFDELKDENGLVSVGQLLSRKREQEQQLDGVNEEEEDVSEVSSNGEEDRDVSDEDDGDVMQTALRRENAYNEDHPEPSSRAAAAASAAAPKPSESAKGAGVRAEASLNQKREELQALQDSIPLVREAMIAAASSGMDASILKGQLENDYERTSTLATEIEAMEDGAWEPVMKGDTILMYYNWLVQAEVLCPKPATVSPPRSAFAPTRLLIRATGNTQSGAHRAEKDPSVSAQQGGFILESTSSTSSGGADAHLWGVIRRRSSVTKRYAGKWLKCLDAASGHNYYSNSATGVTQWEKPSGLVEFAADDSGAAAEEDAEEWGGEGYSGWEAIASPEGDVLYYYDYSTGNWQYDAPTEWDQVSYQTQWPKEEGRGSTRASGVLEAAAATTAACAEEMAKLKKLEMETIQSMQSIISGLKDVLTAASNLPAAALTPALFDLDPKALLDKLEKDHSDLSEQVMISAGVSNLRKSIDQQETISKRRTTVTQKAMEARKSIAVARKPSSSIPTDTAATAKTRKRTMSIHPSNKRDLHMWSVLVSGSKPQCKSATGATIYKHERSGRMFTFNETEGGEFLPVAS